jgi:hypothetical protein
MPEIPPDQLILLNTLQDHLMMLCLMAWFNRPVAYGELARALGVSEQTAYRRIKALIDFGLVGKSTWGKYELCFNVQEFLDGLEKLTNVIKTPINNINFNSLNLKENHLLIIEQQSSQKLLVPEAESPTAPLNEAVWEVLHDAGIGEPKCSQLARLPDLSPEVIETWRTYLKHNPRVSYSTGLLIHVLEKGQTLPETNKHGHALDCTCKTCSRKSYTYCPICDTDPCKCGLINY